MYLQKCLQSVCDVSSMYVNSKIFHVYGLLLLARPSIFHIILHNSANCIIYSTKKYKHLSYIKRINDSISKILLRLEIVISNYSTKDNDFICIDIIRFIGRLFDTLDNLKHTLLATALAIFLKAPSIVCFIEPPAISNQCFFFATFGAGGSLTNIRV